MKVMACDDDGLHATKLGSQARVVVGGHSLSEGASCHQLTGPDDEHRDWADPITSGFPGYERGGTGKPASSRGCVEVSASYFAVAEPGGGEVGPQQVYFTERLLPSPQASSGEEPVKVAPVAAQSSDAYCFHVASGWQLDELPEDLVVHCPTGGGGGAATQQVYFRERLFPAPHSSLGE
jgi:hypothetical protein